MNIIRAFIFITIVASAALQASQSDVSKTSQAKNGASKQPTKQQAQKPAAQKEKAPAQKQPAPKEKTATPAAAPVPKKLKPSAASTAVLLKHSASPGYIAPFEKISKPSVHKPSSPTPVLKKNPIFQAPAKVQILGDVEIGNKSKQPIVITSIMFSYTFMNTDAKKNSQSHTHTNTHKITFSRGYIIPAQKKLAFTITMKNHETLQFAGIKSIQTKSGNIIFDQPITDLSKPIVLNINKKGNIQLLE